MVTCIYQGKFVKDQVILDKYPFVKECYEHVLHAVVSLNFKYDVLTVLESEDNTMLLLLAYRLFFMGEEYSYNIFDIQSNKQIIKGRVTTYPSNFYFYSVSNTFTLITFDESINKYNYLLMGVGNYRTNINKPNMLRIIYLKAKLVKLIS